MLKAFRICLLIYTGFAASLLFCGDRRRTGQGILMLLWACAGIALLLALFCRLTRGTPMTGLRAYYFSALLLLSASGVLIPGIRWVAVSGGFAVAAIALWLLLCGICAWFEWKFVRCPACGKHLPLFGDLDQCRACHAKFEDAPS